MALTEGKVSGHWFDKDISYYHIKVMVKTDKELQGGFVQYKEIWICVGEDNPKDVYPKGTKIEVDI